jgi:hypothetical protein
MNGSWRRLQTPYQQVFLRRLSAHYRRPQPAGTRYQRGSVPFARAVLNRAQIALIECDYRPDRSALDVDIGCLNPIAGSLWGAGQQITLNYDGTNTTPITANEKDAIAFAGASSATNEAVASAASGDIAGRRRVVVPDAFPHQGGI